MVQHLSARRPAAVTSGPKPPVYVAFLNPDKSRHTTHPRHTPPAAALYRDARRLARYTIAWRGKLEFPL